MRSPLFSSATSSRSAPPPPYESVAAYDTPPPAFASRESTLAVSRIRASRKSSSTDTRSPADEKAFPASSHPPRSGPGLGLELDHDGDNDRQHGFFHRSVGHLRNAFTGAPPVVEDQASLASRLAQESRLAPSAAEAAQRLRQLEAAAAAARLQAGPRETTGIFRASCSTDLVFLLDATGSMDTYILAAKDQVRAIVSDIRRAFFHEADVRVAIVGYRDHGDLKQFEVLDFTDNISRVFDFLDLLQAEGGADNAEDVVGGLERVLQLSWMQPTRCVMHIADAPGHGSDLHSMAFGSDRFLDPATAPGNRPRYDSVVAALFARRIHYFFFSIDSNTYKMTAAFARVYNAAGSPYVALLPQNPHCAELELVHARPSRTTAAIRDPGGPRFQEVCLGTSYKDLQLLVVSGVTAATSQTAVRLSATLVSSKSSGGASSCKTTGRSTKPIKLVDLAEDEEVDVFEDSKLSLSAWRSEDHNVNHTRKRGTGQHKSSRKTRTRPVELDASRPQWFRTSWFDQKLRVKAFSPDVVGVVPGPAGNEGSSSGSGGSMLDRMMASDEHIHISTNELIIHRRTTPFAQGALRVAAYARTESSPNPLVVKTFKAQHKRLADLAEDMRIQALCKAFALEFNGLMDSELYALDFVVATCLQPMGADGDGDDGDDGERECMLLEPMLPHERFVKYNNNCGHVNRAVKTPTNEAAQAFSHFTFERSHGAMLVTDLQGVGNVLTDPVVHTFDPARFVLSDTNLGVDGFKLFFASHTCNALCRRLRLLSTGDMFVRLTGFRFRTRWPATDPEDTSSGPVLVCCANKLCARIVRAVATHSTAPGVSWCFRCWPQLSSSSVKRVCATPGAYHEFDVPRFFFEAQGRLLPEQCPEHGGAAGLPRRHTLQNKGRGLLAWCR